MVNRLTIRYLLGSLLVVLLGFLLLHAGSMERSIAAAIGARMGDATDAALFIALFLLAHAYVRCRLPEADPFILPAVALLSGVGLIMMLRLSPDLAIARNGAIQAILSRDPGADIVRNVPVLAQLGTRHFIHIASGVLVLVMAITIFSGRTFAWLSSKKYLWVLLSAVLVICTVIFGISINNRKLWLFGFQTVELAKLLMLFFVAGYISEKARGIALYREGGLRAWFGYAGPFVAMWFFALAPLVIQKDLGPTVLIFVVMLLMFYYAGNRKTMVALFILLIIATGYISYTTGYPPIVRERFDILFDPFGRSEAMSRALWAISSGGFIGNGIGHGQPYKIPEVQSDFNFTAICEEMGFVGGFSLVLGYAVFIQRCFSIALATEDSYKRTLLTGIVVLTGMQAFIIICGDLCVIPLTGITLPFVSYGGSSMVINFLMAGIALRISGEK